MPRIFQLGEMQRGVFAGQDDVVAHVCELMAEDRHER